MTKQPADPDDPSGALGALAEMMGADTPAPTTVAAELAALRKLTTVLEPLDERTRLRVLSWLSDRFQAPGPPWEMTP